MANRDYIRLENIPEGHREDESGRSVANAHQRHAKHQTMQKMKRNFSHSHPGLNMYTPRTAYQNTQGQKQKTK